VAEQSPDWPEEQHHAAMGKRGTWPSTPKDQRTMSAYIYGAICLAEGKGAGLVLPRCNTEGMTFRLAEISTAVAPGAHAVLLLDQARLKGSGYSSQHHPHAGAAQMPRERNECSTLI
jgi:hypothetical protein